MPRNVKLNKQGKNPFIHLNENLYLWFFCKHRKSTLPVQLTKKIENFFMAKWIPYQPKKMTGPNFGKVPGHSGWGFCY